MILEDCSSRVVLSYLLAALFLALSLPTPNSFRTPYCDDTKIPAESQESMPDDTELPEDEPPFDELGLRVTALRRSRSFFGPNGLRASHVLRPWTYLAAFQSRPWWLIRFETDEGFKGHFAAEGRALRLWVQSQTC
jgi:hypothetical protein